MYTILYLTLILMTSNAEKTQNSPQAVVTAVTTTTNKTSNELAKSRIEDGRFVNSFNPQYKRAHLGLFIKWQITERDNTGLPCKKKELDKMLPIIRHEKPEELYLTKPGLRYIWIGHSSCFVQMNNFRFLVDPVFR